MQYKKYFTISYDDGSIDDKRMIEIMDAYGIKGTFNLNSGNMAPIKNTYPRSISLEEIPEVYKNHEVATHGFKHPNYNQLTREEIEDDIKKDIALLSKIVGYDTLGHAYPYGVWNQTTLDVFTEQNIRYARTVGSSLRFDLPTNPLLISPTSHHSDPHIFTVLDEFIKAEPTDSDLLFYLWGHSYEFSRNLEFSSWDHFEKICKLISGKDDIVYCTNMEFFNITNI
ncbi:MAG: polysaccharide deacetylase [Ruminococcaceae bacterium]|nr:polysaccharide deacetylase [Oscillospiraceae bacterium]